MSWVSPSSAPKPMPTGAEIDLPESLGYRIKNKILGPPLETDQLEHERLGVPTALAVFSSDCISSSAYATEEILRVLIPAVGFGAFTLVVPVTMAMLIVLFFLILSYRETIKEYPTAGGAYMVTRDNFGLLPAQVAGVSLLTDYVLTVAVSVAAGTAALASAFHAIGPYSVPISLAFIALIAFMNLKGVRESGKAFAAPTYFFIVIMLAMIVIGIVKASGGDLGHFDLSTLHDQIGHKRSVTGTLGQVFAAAGIANVLHAFAVSGTAVTGVEAISNGVTAFRKPEWKNARKTLVIMGCTLGVLFLGLSFLSTKVHPFPTESGYPTVISQVGQQVFGKNVVFYALQAGTMLILVLAANTSFADFPRLASFHAGDNFMPKQLTKRGHRLVFSNGILFLAGTAALLIVATGAKVEHLIPFYAIGVFSSFTLSQAGMAKHHLTRKEPGWRKGIFINGFGSFLSFVVLIVFLWFKAPKGAWVILVIVPVMVALLMRLNKQYESEARDLERDAAAALAQPILRRHVVLVLIDNLDQSAARAIQYARTLLPDELRAVHIAVDRMHGEYLAEEWRRLGLSRVPLELVDCPTRRIARSALEVVARELGDGHTEVSVLIPTQVRRRFWHRLLHDRTADEITRAVGRLPHANVTSVPFHLGEQGDQDLPHLSVIAEPPDARPS
ncbi:MAG: APC family permease [Acidimicrobiia bacterium]